MKITYQFLLSMLALMSVISGCSTAPSIRPGQWSLQAPSGVITTVEVSSLRKNEFYFYAPRHPVSGVYTWDGDLLRITKPDNPRMGGYVWKLDHDHSLTLVEETPVPISGEKLISAHMWRMKD